MLTATYFAFRDDVLTSLIARQAEMQFAYEDRIAELRAQVDRMSSRQLLDQEQVEHKLDQILRRQTTLEQRANTLSTLPDLGITGAIRRRWPRRPLGDQARRRSTTSQPPAALPRRKSRDRHISTAWSRALPHRSIVSRPSRPPRSPRSKSSYDLKARRIRGVLSDLGIDAGKTRRPADADATGGPFVPHGCDPTAAPSSASSIASGLPARMLISSIARSPMCRCASRSPARSILVRLRHADRSIPEIARDAYRPRHARRPRRSGARNRERHGDIRRLARRLRQDGRDRPRQRRGDALRPPLRASTPRSATRSRSAKSSARSARPAAPPDRICTTRRASTAKRSIRSDSCARAGSSVGCIEPSILRACL